MYNQDKIYYTEISWERWFCGLLVGEYGWYSWIKQNIVPLLVSQEISSCEIKTLCVMMRSFTRGTLRSVPRERCAGQKSGMRSVRSTLFSRNRTKNNCGALIMDRQDWYRMGTQIGDLVQSAIDNKDFKELNESILKTVNATLDTVQKNMQDGFRQAQDTMQEEFKAGSWKAAYDRAAKMGEHYRNGERRGVGGRGTAGHWNAENGTAQNRNAGNKTAPNWNMGNKTAHNENSQIWNAQHGHVKQTTAQKRAVQKTSSKAMKSSKGTAGMAVGYTFSGIFGVMTLIFALLARALSPMIVPAVICLVLTIGFLTMGLKGRKFNARLKRQRQYLQIMGMRDTCTLEELAAGTGNTKKYVARDLREMIQDHMFPQGAYLDAQETCLMTSQTAYRQYQDVIKQYEQRKAETAKAEAKKAAQNQQEKALSKEIQDILREGRGFIEHIRECNDAIPDEMISDKLDRLELVVTRIFDQVARKPESAPDLRKMMSYYLPITRKLVDAYRDLDAQPTAGENIRNTKKEIGDSLDTINTAFENLLDSFFQDTAWDISSDINVLRTMMAQDGLMGQEFKTNKDK